MTSVSLPSSPALGFRRDIEGLRALAIVAVAGYHAGLPGFAGGYVGVDVFFVISGYLISSRLLEEIEREGSVRLWRFYARRAARLLPALVLMTLAVGVASIFVYAPLEQRTVANQVVTSSAYVSNVWFAWNATDYFRATPELMPLLHTWSLSVEEQFYLVWPALLLLGAGSSVQERRREKLRTVVMILTAASLAGSVLLTPPYPHLAFFLAPFRVWQFGAGALVLLSTRPLGGRTRDAMALVGAAAIVLAIAGFDDAVLYPGFAALIPVIGTCLLLRAGDDQVLRLSGLGSWPVQYLGRLSYSWYLWHWPVVTLARALDLAQSTLSSSLWTLAALVPAAVSFHLVEDPLRRSQVLLGRPTRGVGYALLVLAVGVGVGLGWRVTAISWSNSPDQKRYLEQRWDTENLREICGGTTGPIVPCGGRPGEPDLVLLGDSYAEQWLTPVREVARNEGFSLGVAVRPGCPPAFVRLGHGYISRRRTECNEWLESVVAELVASPPRVIVMSAYPGYNVSESEWSTGTAALLQQLARVAERVVVVEPPPAPGVDVTACLARRAWRPAFLPQPDCELLVDDTSSGFHWVDPAGIERIDLRAAVRELLRSGSCGGVYRDSGHITASAARCLTPEFSRVLSKNQTR